jgi:hypothetical protein
MELMVEGSVVVVEITVEVVLFRREGKRWREGTAAYG